MTDEQKQRIERTSLYLRMAHRKALAAATDVAVANTKLREADAEVNQAKANFRKACDYLLEL